MMCCEREELTPGRHTRRHYFFMQVDYAAVSLRWRPGGGALRLVGCY